MRRRAIHGAVLILSVLIVTGCTGNVATGVTEKELIGSWSVGDGFDTEVELFEDGSLVSSRWPTQLGCDASASSNVSELRASEQLDPGGRWQSYGGDLQYQVSLTFDAQECSEGGVFAFVWRAPGGELALCVKIPRDAPMDSLRPDQYFVLNQGESFGSMISDGCQ